MLRWRLLALMSLVVLLTMSHSVMADIIVTEDKQTYRGQVIKNDASELVLKTRFGTLTIPKSEISKHTKTMYTVTLSDGKQVRGKVLSSESGNIVVQKIDGSKQTLTASKVDKVREDIPLTAQQVQELREKHQKAIEKLMAKDYEPAIKLYRDILKIRPEDSTAIYNIACAYSLMNKRELAVEYLRKSVEAGFVSFPHIEQDKDLDNIRDHPSYKALLADRFKYLERANDRRVEQINQAMLDKGVDPEQYTRVYDKEHNFLFLHNKSEEDFDQIRAVLNQYAEFQWKNLLVNKPRDPLYIVLLTEEDTPKIFAQSVGGVFQPATNTLFVGDLPTWQLLKTSVLIHEFTHALHFADMRARQLRAMHPIWVIEGLATLYENSDRSEGKADPQDSQRLQILHRLYRANRGLRFRQLFNMTHPQFMRNAALTYAQSRYIFKFMHDGGMLNKFYETLNDKEVWERDKTGIEAMEIVYGKPIEQIERDWLKWLTKQKLPPRITMGLGATVKDEMLVINRIDRKGPAEKAKLKKGDQFVSVNGQAITDPNSLIRAMVGKEIGDALTIVVKRKDEEKQVILTLEQQREQKAKSPPRKGYLGIAVEDKEGKITIKSVDSGSPAAKAGIEVGDILVKVDKTNIGDVRAFLDLAGKFRAKKNVTIIVEKSDGVKKQLKIRLGTLK